MTLPAYSTLKRPWLARLLALAAGAGLCAGCGQPSGERLITEVRVVDVPGTLAEPSASAAERFGLGEPPSPAAHNAPMQPALEWDVPERWAPAQGNPMRLASFQIAPDTECYLMTFPSEAGGFEANAVRWYGQMGQAPPPPTALADLPVLQVFGQPAPLVYVAGDYTDMTGTTRAGYALLGVAAHVPGGGMLFVKMTGPEQVVLEQRDAFERFCQSIRQVREISP